jgi:hypothetical protein
MKGMGNIAATWKLYDPGIPVVFMAGMQTKLAWESYNISPQTHWPTDKLFTALIF